MRRFMVITIPIVTLALFILIMLSDKFFKKSLSNDDNIPLSIEAIKTEIEKGSWTEAENKTQQLSNAWDKVVIRVQFSAEMDEINEFYKNLARLRGAIEAKDKPNALMELNEAYEHWENIGR